jgi:hypothetical protein
VLTNARGAIGAMCLLEVIPVPGNQRGVSRKRVRKSRLMITRQERSKLVSRPGCTN